MSNTITRIQADFEKLLAADIPGQNWDCDLIHDVGNGYPNTGHSIATRCICWSKDGRPTIRTSLSDAIRRGDMVYIAAFDGGCFFLLEDVPQLELNCYSARGTRCNAFLTIREEVPEQTDAFGYSVRESGERTLMHNIPAVVRHTPTISSGTGAAGMVVEDELTATLQLNAFSVAVPRESFFELDGSRYTITDVQRDGSNHGTITLRARRQAGHTAR